MKKFSFFLPAGLAAAEKLSTVAAAEWTEGVRISTAWGGWRVGASAGVSFRPGLIEGLQFIRRVSVAGQPFCGLGFFFFFVFPRRRAETGWFVSSSVFDVSSRRTLGLPVLDEGWLRLD